MARRCLLCLVLLFVSRISVAGPSGEEDVLFYGGDTVSTPSRRPQSLEEAPAPVTVITREQIRRSGARTLPEVLALAPGVDVVRRSEADVEVSIRGFNSYSSNKVLVLVDSKPLFSLADASVNWDLIPVPIEAIERVEIVRGPGSVHYGENAFFGTINIITTGAQNSNAVAGAGTGGSDYFSAQYASGQWLASAEQLYLNRFDERHADIPNPLFGDTTNKPTVARVNISRALVRWSPLPGNQAPAISGGVVYAETDYRSHQVRDRLAFGAADYAFRADGVDFICGFRVINQEQSRVGFPAPQRPTQYIVRVDSGIQGIYAPAVGDVIVFGADFSHRTVRDSMLLAKEGELNQAVVSGYIENELALAERRIFVTAGVRADAYDSLRGMVSPRAGLVFILTPSQSVKLGWGQAFRSPSLYELYGYDALTPPWIFEGSPSLRPESVESWNLDYFAQNADGGRLAVTLFYHRLSDLIVYELEPGPITERRYRLQNADRAQAYGGEVEFRAPVADRVEIWGNYSYNEARYEWDGHEVKAPFSPRHKANGGVDYADERFRFSVWSHYCGSQVGVNYDAPFRDRLDLEDYLTFSARAEVKLPAGFYVAATASDIFGTGHYEAPSYAPVMPYYFAELRWEPEAAP